MINKKVASEIALGIILLIAVVVGGIFWMQSKTTISNNQNTIDNKKEVQKPIQEEGVVCAQDAKLCDDGSYVSRTGQNCEFSACSTTPNVKAGYKTVDVKNKLVQFSFEVPNGWITETRNSGEKQMTLDEKKDFLSDVFDGDSEYADYTREDFKKMSEKEIEKFFPIGVISSVTDNDRISYSDFAWSQVDFLLLSDDESLKNINDKKKIKGGCFSAFSDKEIGRNTFQDIIISGITGISFLSPSDINENGLEQPSKSCTGGQDIYVKIPNSNKSLEIVKQAMGDEQFEKDFEHLIQTLQIKAL